MEIFNMPLLIIPTNYIWYKDIFLKDKKNEKSSNQAKLPILQKMEQHFNQGRISIEIFPKLSMI